MKRLNPETGKPFVHGETRADGFLFYCYRYDRLKKDGFYGEKWFSPAVFANKLNSVHQWQASNVDKKLNHNREWCKRNKDKCNAINSRKRAARLQRTPKWLTKEHYMQIESVYALAQKVSIDTGIPHEVDHIVPLQGEFVSGLHVPWNLEVKTAEANRRKSNKLLD